MIENILVFLFLTYVNPADPSGNTMYPSGVKDCDKFYFNSPPAASKTPNLVLSMPVYDAENKIIPPGIYETKLSQDTGQILLIQSQEIKAKLPIMQIATLDKTYLIPTVNVKKLSSKHILIILKMDNTEIFSTLYAP